MTDPFSWMPGGNSDGEARDAMEQNEAMIEKAAQEQREFAKLFLDVFGQGRGPELLELLRVHTIELDLFVVSPTIGNALREMGVNPSEWAYHRNGQNSVVRWIEQQLQFARLLENEGSNNV
jgi:hypothetical protein